MANLVSRMSSYSEIFCCIELYLLLFSLSVIDIATTATMWQGVVVNPLEKAYEKPEKEPNVEEMDVSTTEA